MILKRTKITLLIISTVLVTVASPLFSQYDVKTTTETSWITGDILISATAEIPESTTNLTSARFRITETIDRGLTAIVTGAFDGIYLDSLHTLSEGFTSTERRLSDFDALNLKKTRISSSLSLDLDSVTNLYKYNIYHELIPILLSHKKIAPMPVILNYESTASFSGIIIYAAEPLPYYGEPDSGLLQPAIFPKIFDREMDLIASAEMADPEYLAKWGFVLYTDSLDEQQFEERIGLYPYRTTAEAIFGNNRTDILIPEEAARKILYNEANRRLVREGRIMIILGNAKNPETP